MMHGRFFSRAAAGALAAILILGPATLRAQEDTLIDDVVRQGLDWARDNLDEDLLRSLGGVDETRVRRLFQEIQSALQGDDVVDLAALQSTAASVLPLLEADEATRPYASWLRSRMDYFDVAEQVRRSAPTPPVEPGAPLKKIPNPEPARLREIWTRRIEKQTAPKGAEPLAAKLKPLFRAAQMPSELVWVAEVESSFNPAARSPAGAAGLYQLMPQTARSLGLALKPADERLNAEKNAGAAAKYLKYLHGRFKDWRLALAAYNAGEGNLSTLMTRHKARTFDDVSRRLPAETQLYVPKIEATLWKREGVRLASLPAPGK